MKLANVAVETVDPSVLVLETEVTSENVRHAVTRVYQDLGRHLTFPGFRKGKIPREILRQRVGRDTVQQKAIELLLEPAYKASLSQTGLDPVDQVSVEIVDFSEEGRFRFRTKVIVSPTVELGDYEQFTVEMPNIEVTEDQVNEQIEVLRRRYAHLADPGDRGIQKGDVVAGILRVTVANEPSPREPTEIRPFVIGENSLTPSLDAGLLGHRRGEVAAFPVVYPEDYSDKEFAGKPAEFCFVITEFKQRVLPEVDDTFAQQCGGFDTVDALRQEIRRLLLAEAESRARHDLEEKIVDQLLERSKLELPELLLQKRVERRLQTFAEELRERKTTVQSYLDQTHTTLDELRQQIRTTVERELRKGFILQTVATRENLQVSSEDLDRQIAAMARMTKQSHTELRRRLERTDTLRTVEKSILERKAALLLLEKAGFATLASSEETSQPTATPEDLAAAKSDDSKEGEA